MFLKDAFEDCIMMDRTTTSDGRGGYYVSWKEGAKFEGAFDYKDSGVVRIAEALGETSSYTITTYKSIILNIGDIVKRVSDGRYFKVESNGTDNQTPAGASAMMQYRQVKASIFVPAE